MKEEILIHDLHFTPFISESEITLMVDLMASQIQKDYHNKHPVFIVVLNGAFIFASDLLRKVNISCEVDFVKLSSYDGTSSTGQIKEILPHQISLKGRHLVVIEDIIDTGLTMKYYLKQLAALNPASVKLAALLVKPDAIQYPIDIEYKGMEIPDKFVVGYGLDYNQRGRSLKGIYQKVH